MMELLEKITGALIILVLLGFLVAGIFKIFASVAFCEEYFPETATWHCVMSDKYRYDGD